MDWLRVSVAYWHSFLDGERHVRCRDVRSPLAQRGAIPWTRRAEDGCRLRVLAKLGVPFYCFHDRDVAPEGATLRRDPNANLDAMVDDALEHQERTGVRLLWGTAKLFAHPRYMAGAATNPDPGGVRLRGGAGANCSR